MVWRLPRGGAAARLRGGRFFCASIMNTRPWAAATLLRLLCCLTLCGAARAASPDYLDEFPSVERVLQDLGGRDERDAGAKRVGAFRQLSEMVTALAGMRAATPDEAALLQRYNVAQGAIDLPMMASFDPAETQRLGMRSPRAKWVGLCSMYSLDEDLREELLQRYFSPAFRARNEAKLRADMRRFKHAPEDFLQEDSPPALQWLEDLPWWKIPAATLAALTALALLLVLLYCRNELRPHGIDAKDPRLLRSGRRRYDLTSVTGIVAGQTKTDIIRTETTTRADATTLSGQTSTSVSRRTISHQFYIKKPEGKETLVWLNHHRVEIRDGNRLSAVTLTRRKKNDGDYLLFVNHDTEARFFDHALLQRVLRPRYGLIWRLTLALMLLGLYARAAADFPSNRENFPTLFDYSGAVFHNALEVWANWPQAYAAYWLLGVVSFLFAARTIGRLRRRRVEQSGCARLIAELDAEADRQKASGFEGAPITQAS